MGLIACAANDYSIAYVLTHLRHHCLRELTLTRAGTLDDALRDLYDQIEALHDHALVRTALFSTDGYGDPIAIAIVYRVSPVIAMFQAFSTSHWPLIAMPFVRWFHRAVVPVLLQNGILMAETHILDEGPRHYRWLQALGMYRSGGPEPRGVHGELYQRVVWEAKHVRHRQGVLANLHAAGNRRSGGGANPAAGGHAETAAGPGGAIRRVNGCSYAGDAGADGGNREIAQSGVTRLR